MLVSSRCKRKFFFSQVNFRLIGVNYFYLIKINKNSKKIPKLQQDSVVEDIRALRNTKTLESFERKKKSTLAKWKRRPFLKTFLNYFTKQWLDSPFCNWQLFQTPPGYAMSNCPIESYNNKIKAQFTERKKFNLLPVFEIFENVVKFESRESLKYEVPLFSKAKLSVKNEARKYTDSIKKLGIDNGLHQYLCKDTHNVEINPECFCPDCTNCSCCFFLDAAVCIHLVGCCLLDSFDFPGVKPKKFLSKTKSKKRKAGPWHQKD